MIYLCGILEIGKMFDKWAFSSSPRLQILNLTTSLTPYLSLSHDTGRLNYEKNMWMKLIEESQISKIDLLIGVRKSNNFFETYWQNVNYYFFLLNWHLAIVLYFVNYNQYQTIPYIVILLQSLLFEYNYSIHVHFYVEIQMYFTCKF